jgi:hypothetical protein
MERMVMLRHFGHRQRMGFRTAFTPLGLTH